MPGSHLQLPAAVGYRVDAIKHGRVERCGANVDGSRGPSPRFPRRRWIENQATATCQPNDFYENFVDPALKDFLYSSIGSDGTVYACLTKEDCAGDPSATKIPFSDVKTLYNALGLGNPWKACEKAPSVSRRVVSADESRRRRGHDVDIPWGRVAPPPRPRRGYSARTGRAHDADRLDVWITHRPVAEAGTWAVPVARSGGCSSPTKTAW